MKKLIFASLLMLVSLVTNAEVLSLTLPAYYNTRIDGNNTKFEKTEITVKNIYDNYFTVKWKDKVWVVTEPLCIEEEGGFFEAIDNKGNKVEIVLIMGEEDEISFMYYEIHCGIITYCFYTDTRMY